MKLIIKGVIGGFVFGVLFAYAHLFLNFRYDLPLYFILSQMDAFITCQGRSCAPFLLLGGLTSTLFWALIGGVIEKLARRIQTSSSFS